MLVFYPSMPGVLRAKTAQIWAGARRTLSKICATRASPLPATCPLTMPLTSAARLAISLVSSGSVKYLDLVFWICNQKQSVGTKG